MKDSSITWNAVPGAVKYLVELENTSTSEKFNFETTQTSFTIHGVPVGTYNLTVRAEMGDGSTSIIVEEVVSL